MPLLKDGRLAEDAWTHVPDGAELTAGGCLTVTLGRFLAEPDALLSRNTDFGVRLGPADDPALLVPYLERIGLIEVHFPRYTDGRGHSIAQLLRRRYGYSRELRAVGHVLRDQLGLMVRNGFDAMQIDHADPEGAYADAVATFSQSYQGAADRQPSVFERRHSSSGATDRKADQE